jgi:transmembrane sensor
MKPTYSAHINQAAREWFTQLQSGQVTKTQREAYEQWLAQDPQHRQAIADYQRIWDDLAALGKTAEGRRLRGFAHSTSLFGKCGQAISNAMTALFNWFTPPRTAMVLTGAGIALGLTLFNHQEPVNIQTYATATAETLNLRLEDGSQVSLSAQTTIKTWFTSSERHVALVKGEAYFTVAKNPQKPFWVEIDNTLVKVVGTQFDIKKNVDRVKVAVAEGVVNVFSAPDSKNKFADVKSLTPVTLTRGQQVENIKGAGLGQVSSIHTNELASWREGRLVYRAEKLKNIIRDANRYNRKPIHIEDKLAELEVTASISISQIDKLPETLAQLLPIQIEQRVDAIYVTAKD